MDKRNAFERQLANEIDYEVGPPQVVDALAIARQARTTTPRWRFMTMPSVFKFAAAAVAFLLAGGLLLTAAVTSPSDERVTPATEVGTTEAFPTGLFVSTSLDDWFMRLNEDGTARVFIHGHNVFVDFEYEVEGDLMTEALDIDDGDPDMSYQWAYDGQILTMEPIGEVSETHPYTRTGGAGWRFVPDPVEVVVAAEEIEAGGTVYSTWAVIGIVPGAEAPADAYLEVADVIGRIAAEPIAPGRPITPDMLEPAE